MSALPSSAVTIGDGEITIADLLALKLGLSVKVLKSEMRHGCVYSVTEQGIDKDAGRTPSSQWSRSSWLAVQPRLAENRGLLGPYLLRKIGRLRTILRPRTVSR